MHYNIIYLKDKIMEIRTNKSYMIFYSFNISLLIWDFKEKNKMPNILYKKKIPKKVLNDQTLVSVQNAWLLT